ncbi:MAG: NUDIX domain-containing protein [Clostridiales bacterium]|nr:NUDIX domain-containing protein [Clostridiales bacterium]
MELFDIVDEYGNPTGETVERTYAHQSGIRHRTAHVWLLRTTNDKVEVLVQKRSDDKDSFPGCYDISSAGHIPAGQDYIESALRELHEELGLDVSPEQLHLCGSKSLATDDCFHGIPFHDRQFTRIYAMWYDRSLGSITPQPEEISEVRWTGLDECIRLVEANDKRFCIDAYELYLLKEFSK